MIRKTINIFVFAFSLLLTGFANADANLLAVERYLTENEITYAASGNNVLTYHTEQTELDMVALYMVANHPTVHVAHELVPEYKRPRRVKKKT